MYDELVKRLRDAAKMSDALAVLLPNSGGNATAKLYNEAADAIEKLSDIASTTATIIENEQDMRVIAQAPCWIPVTEKLPEKKEAYYLGLLDDDSMEVVYWSKVPNWASDGEWTWHNPNWKNVTHWMPLPEPPKEE